MTPITLELSWRSWAKAGFAVVPTIAAGATGLTAGAPWIMRVPALLMFALGVYWLVDVIIFTSSWRATAGAVKIPTLARRHREVSGSDLTVEFVARRHSAIRISGPKGSRDLMTNPIVSDRDVRRWFERIGD